MKASLSRFVKTSLKGSSLTDGLMAMITCLDMAISYVRLSKDEKIGARGTGPDPQEDPSILQAIRLCSSILMIL